MMVDYSMVQFIKHQNGIIIYTFPLYTLEMISLYYAIVLCYRDLPCPLLHNCILYFHTLAAYMTVPCRIGLSSLGAKSSIIAIRSDIHSERSPLRHPLGARSYMTSGLFHLFAPNSTGYQNGHLQQGPGMRVEI